MWFASWYLLRRVWRYSSGYHGTKNRWGFVWRNDAFSMRTSHRTTRNVTTMQFGSISCILSSSSTWKKASGRLHSTSSTTPETSLAAFYTSPFQKTSHHSLHVRVEVVFWTDVPESTWLHANIERRVLNSSIKIEWCCMFCRIATRVEAQDWKLGKRTVMKFCQVWMLVWNQYNCCQFGSFPYCSLSTCAFSKSS